MLPERGRHGLPHLRVGDPGLPDGMPSFADTPEIMP